MTNEIAARLNALTEELNDMLVQATDALTKLNLGAPANVDLDEGRKLSFRKDAKGWGLFIDHIPILSASREARIKSVDKLDELLTAMTDAASTEIERVKQAVETASRFVARISS